jgi:hypothetical protein
MSRDALAGGTISERSTRVKLVVMVEPFRQGEHDGLGSRERVHPEEVKQMVH